MSESIKAICVVMLIAGATTAGIAWTEERPTDAVWLCRLGGAAAAVVSLVVFVYIHFRKDKAPDYLRAQVGDYLNRNGLAFVCGWTVERRIAFITVYFQNQYSRPAVGEIAMRPQRGLFARRSELEPIEVRIECGPGAFGITRLPVALPLSMQGTQIKFDLGATVTYPEGKGAQLRYHEGKTLRWNKNFRNPFGSFLSIAGLFGGALVWTGRSRIEFSLPDDVASTFDTEPQVKTNSLWQLGDPPL